METSLSPSQSSFNKASRISDSPSQLFNSPSNSEKGKTIEKRQGPISSSEYLFTLEDCQAAFSIKDILNMAYGNNQHFISHNGNYDFYVRILLYTKSVFIDHSYNNLSSNQVSEIAYSKLKILKIISPLQWGNCWLSKKTIKQGSNSVTFTYYDYKKAWQTMLLFQNKAFHHSWFIHFDPQSFDNIPNWFCDNWWTSFGPDYASLNEPSRQAFQSLKEELNFDHDSSSLQIPELPYKLLQ